MSPPEKIESCGCEREPHTCEESAPSAGPPSWDELTTLARAARVTLMRRRMSISVFTDTAIVSRMFDISIGDLEDEDADRMLRAMTAVALSQLQAML